MLRQAHLRGVRIEEGWWFRRIVLLHESGLVTVARSHRWRHFGGASAATVTAQATRLAEALKAPLLP